MDTRSIAMTPKIWFLGLLGLFAASGAFSQTTITPDQLKETCGKMSAIAEHIMKSRQEGVAMQKLMNQYSVSGTTEAVIADAYSSPRMGTEESQNREIEEFRDKYYLDCYKKLKPHVREAQ
jgi:hypothetical protein